MMPSVKIKDMGCWNADLTILPNVQNHSPNTAPHLTSLVSSVTLLHEPQILVSYVISFLAQKQEEVLSE
jgi:hypothetical protein